MNPNTATEIDISAILSTYVYLDDQCADYANKNLEEILSEMEKNLHNKNDEYKSYFYKIKEAVDSSETLKQTKLVSQSMEDGFSDDLIIACAFESPDGNLYVSYRGTGDGKWPDNADALSSKNSIMQETANQYFDKLIEENKYFKNIKGKLIVTGHSKGGNEAQYVALRSKYGSLIDNCYSIDGQGFSKEAIEYFIELYGEEHYLEQIYKMYSINGENDYVHDLGIVVIPEERTFFVKTPDANSLEGFHMITYMLSGAGLNWEINEDGNIVSAEQGPMGRLAKALSSKMMEMDAEDFRDCALSIMSMLELAMGKECKVGTGDKKFATVEEFVGFLAYGIPLLADVLVSEEGLDLIMSGIELIYEKYGVMGVVGGTFLVSLAVCVAGKLLLGLGVLIANVNVYAKILDKITDFIDNLTHNEEFITWFSSLKENFINIISNVFNDGFICRSSNLDIGNGFEIDTYKLRLYAQRLNNINTRLYRLDKRLDTLYWSVGLLSLWNIMQADMLVSHSWRITRCSTYLYETANDLEKIEIDLMKKT